MADEVIVETGGPVHRIRINRPERKNALDLATIHALRSALDEANAQEAARVVVIEGTGGDFSAGGDVNDMIDRRGKAFATYDRLRVGLGELISSLRTQQAVTLARVDGVCMGAGAGLALACDALVATQESRFGFPFVGVGLAPDTATSWLLPRVVGLQNARRLLLTGEIVDAGQAEAMGMLTHVAGDRELLDAWITDFTSHVQTLGKGAIRDTRSVILDNLDVPISTGLVREALTQGLRFTTQEHASAVDAFLQRRKGT